MIHNEYNRFSDLPDDAQRAFERAVRYLKREHPECGPQVGIWRDVAKRLWTDKMQYARPEVTGLQRAKGLVIASRLVVWSVACQWQGGPKLTETLL